MAESCRRNDRNGRRRYTDPRGYDDYDSSSLHEVTIEMVLRPETDSPISSLSKSMESVTCGRRMEILEFAASIEDKELYRGVYGEIP